MVDYSDLFRPGAEQPAFSMAVFTAELGKAMEATVVLNAIDVATMRAVLDRIEKMTLAGIGEDGKSNFKDTRFALDVIESLQGLFRDHYAGRAVVPVVSLRSKMEGDRDADAGQPVDEGSPGGDQGAGPTQAVGRKARRRVRVLREPGQGGGDRGAGKAPGVDPGGQVQDGDADRPED